MELLREVICDDDPVILEVDELLEEATWDDEIGELELDELLEEVTREEETVELERLLEELTCDDVTVAEVLVSIDEDEDDLVAEVTTELEVEFACSTPTT